MKSRFRSRGYRREPTRHSEMQPQPTASVKGRQQLFSRTLQPEQTALPQSRLQTVHIGFPENPFPPVQTHTGNLFPDPGQPALSIIFNFS